LVDYYEVLQVKREARGSEIKRAFRRLLKRYHPDRNRANAAWAEQRTREIVEAYHVLSDERRRKLHDQQLRMHSFSVSTVTSSVSYGPPSSGNGVAAKCRELFDCLLKGHTSIALALYEQLRGSKPTFDLYPHLSLKDHLDCKFLLGEAYERQGNFAAALELYEEVYREELEGPRLRYFFDEVQERIVAIYCQQLPRVAEPKDAVRHFRHALTLGLPPRETAEIHKRLAETLLKISDREGARRELRQAIKMHPGIKGVQRLAARLGMRAVSS